jgi:hypothetical protein
MDLESPRRTGEESSLGNDVQHGEKDGHGETRTTLGKRGIVSPATEVTLSQAGRPIVA